MENKKKDAFPGYPSHPASEDIYNKEKETDLDPENITKIKSEINESGEPQELNFENDLMGDDLDVPGSEMDDQQENIGSEDEENNFYSLGGDNHQEDDNGSV